MLRIGVFYCLTVLLSPVAIAELVLAPADFSDRPNLRLSTIAALDYSPALRAARNNVNAIAQELTSAKGDFLPAVSFRLSYGSEYNNTPSLRAEGLSSRTMSPFSNTFHIKELLFTGWRTTNQIKQQRAKLKSAYFDYVNTRESEVFAAVTAYLNVLRTQQLLELAKENNRLHREVLSMVRALREAKATTIANVQLANSRYIFSQASLANATQSLYTADAAFVSAIGERPQNLTPISFDHESLWQHSDAVLREAEEYNPSVQSAQASVTAANAQVKVARANFYPQVSFDVDANLSHDIGGIDGDDNSVSGNVVVNYDIFSGGKDLAQVREAAARHLEAFDHLHDTQRFVEQDIQKNLTTLKTNQDSINYLKKYVVESDHLYASYREQFISGQQTLFNVLDAGNQLYNAKVVLTNQLYDDMLAYFKVLAVLGKLTEKVVASHAGFSA